MSRRKKWSIIMWVTLVIFTGGWALACGDNDGVIDNNPNDPVAPVGRVNITLASNALFLTIRIEVTDTNHPSGFEIVPTTDVPMMHDTWEGYVEFDVDANFTVKVWATVKAQTMSKYAEGRLYDTQKRKRVSYVPPTSVTNGERTIFLKYTRVG